ncbi:MAG: hypothetical protein V1794_02720 [Candidatus Glassbacteria bacterium]
MPGSDLIERTTTLAFLAAILAAGCSAGPVSRTAESSAPAQKRYAVVKPGTHPGIIFAESELPQLRARTKGSGLAAEAYARIKEMAAGDLPASLDSLDLVNRDGGQLAGQLQALALVYQVEGDEPAGRRAVELFRAVIQHVDPVKFYFEGVGSDFFATEHWPKAFAFAWDWLYPLMTEDDRRVILDGLEAWCKALDAHTDSWWWRDASINCGAIPVGALGLLCVSIQAETHHPDFKQWYESCFRRLKQNYFRSTWRDNGICTEGPGYAHYHENPTEFFEAVRRTGGPDVIGQTGAVNAMHYLRFHWLPGGGCVPVGDNTGYGRRVFQAIYLHGLRETRDAAGLWTFEKYTDRRRFDQIQAFLFYPDGLEPVSPGLLDLPTSYFFEIDRNRAGTVFSRSEWDSEKAAFFAFVTRYESANHTHYDMNTFLFSAFGENFGAHSNIWGYGHEYHGVDFEHNIVIIDEGGMPAADRNNSAGDDGSTDGYLTGLGLGHFADYVRGDARLSYQDRSVPTTTAAIRADRSAIFAKQGPNPYLVVADDIQKDGNQHDYHWQWYTWKTSVTGQGTLEDPLVIEGDSADCAIAFLVPEAPEIEFRIQENREGRRVLQMGLVRVNRRGVRERFVAVAAAWEKGGTRPRFSRGPAVNGNPEAVSLLVEGEGYTDLVLWQPEEYLESRGEEITCAGLATDGLMALVRTDNTGRVLGYLLGDGHRLEFHDQPLAQSNLSWSVSADGKRVFATGARRARQDLPPIPAEGTCRVLAAESEVWADGKRIGPFMVKGMMAIIRPEKDEPAAGYEF